ncbi:MAG TPA: hypothetical protein VN579_07270 [Bryobacteraceae bacterium]|nr:hypothetical protein [Bryobacteraceae bacterium]
MSDPVTLQFTQEDRDRLIRMEGRMESFMLAQEARLLQGKRRMANHGRRITSLERTRDEGRGAVWAFRWLWAAFVALAGLLGWHLKSH